MSTRERRLLRKQINLKLGYMSNKEAQENDYLNSSQMLTERQQMYMIISNQLRKSDNRKKSKKKLPFLINSASFPHVNVGRVDRLLNSTKAILQNSEQIDKVIKAHSFRTATPYYTNPELTIDRGNVPNYSQHIGALLHTPRYIDFLKTGCGSARESQNSKAENKKSSETSEKYPASLDEFLSSVTDSSSLKSSSSTTKNKDKSRRSTFSFLPVNQELSSTPLCVSSKSKRSSSSIEKQESNLNSTQVLSPKSDTQDDIINANEIVNFPITHSPKSDERFEYSNSSQKSDNDDKDFGRKSVHSSSLVSSKRESNEINIEYTNKNEDNLNNSTSMSRSSSKKSFCEKFGSNMDKISPNSENESTISDNIEFMTSKNKKMPPNQNGQKSVDETIEMNKESGNFFSSKLENDQTHPDKMDFTLDTRHDKPIPADINSQIYVDETVEINKENEGLFSPKLDKNQTHPDKMELTIEASQNKPMSMEKSSEKSRYETIENKRGSIEILSSQRDHDEILSGNVELDFDKLHNKTISSDRNSQTSFHEELKYERKVSLTNNDSVSNSEKENLSDEETIFDNKSDCKLDENSHQKGIANIDNDVDERDSNDKTLVTSPKLQNSDLIVQLVNFLYDNNIDNQDFLSMHSFFETMNNFRKSKPEYVEEYRQFLMKSSGANFTKFADILYQNDIYEITNQQAADIKILLKDFKTYLLTKSNEASQNEIKTVENKKEGDIIVETKENKVELLSDSSKKDIQKEELEFEKNDNVETKVIIENEIVDDHKKVENNIMIRKQSLEIDDENKNLESYDDDFSEEFHKLFQISMVVITQDDIDEIKQLVMNYQENINRDDLEEQYEDEMDDFEFYQSFRDLFRNSISEMNNEDVDAVQRLVKQFEDSDDYYLISEDEETDDKNAVVPFKRLFRGSLGSISKKDLENVKSTIAEYQNPSTQQVFNDRKFSMPSISENNKVVPFKALFRRSIGNIKEDDLEKISKIIEDHEKNMTDKVD